MTEDKSVDEGRRGFLISSVAVATTFLAPGVTLYALGGDAAAAETAPASAKVRWGLLIDAAKCGDGCSACIDACSRAHGWQSTGHPETDPQWVRKITATDPKTGAGFSAPVMCQHCANAPCVDVCPTGASFKRADGIVLVDRHICIGCRYCMMACPYKARSFVHEPVADQKPDAPRGKGTVESCTLCASRIDAGGVPHCVEACKTKGHGAIVFGDLNDPSSDIAKRIATYRSTRIRADLGCDAAVYYTNI
ncbi:4Fe-4S ferredoxin iron-sulfur binding domain-containing protein [Rhodomicrobium vannielii ATCC 17100]|uniref:4Fe-4S ferredoxin iron-sulfur binding domain-containing protein n=1 Tax=Rhodomicrobium vannielii (strain ATCC 17100 / DSM 162 / LMG 4299 / NCIMB 10020 / ATH 3.1.1) TaxID=648757 RepID=E3HZC3_RHOVT|nr:4Fe-4S dicluster domain-containing protein [Rhodomicrobium vannielii]ADP69869.1 4Fe-4S ferredoxin iron-sulfur binding domain-containing protein [Rhodomicrobium vannielii ATCC 17100]